MFNMSDTVNIANLPHNEVFYFTAIAVITHTSVSTLIHRGILKSGNVYKWPYTNRRYTFSIIIILCMLCFFLDIKNNPFDCGLVLTSSLSSGTILILALSTTIFIITTISLVRTKARLQRDLELVQGENIKGNTPAYEEIVLSGQNQTQHTPNIDTSENIAYGHMSSRRL